ncbi:MAG: hypothetical protein WAM24_07120 [Ignavibacteriaceae bacterium]
MMKYQDDLISIDEQDTYVNIHPVQDFYDGKMYYGLMNNGADSVVNSDGEILSLTQMKNRGFNLIVDKISNSRFPLSLINTNQLNLTIALDQIFFAVNDYFKKYLYLKDHRYYDVLTAWSIGTYIFKIFPSYPYLHFHAERGSGKTAALTLLKHICFNGNSSSYITRATLYRLVHSELSTLGIDEAEHFSSNSRNKDNSIIEVLKSGYSESGVALVQNEDFSNTLKLSTYCPKAFAGIESLDSVLRDRTIRIPIIRKPDRIKLEPYSTKDKYWQQYMATLRANLYYVGLKFANEIKDIYQILPERPEMESITNRHFELWSPLIAIAEVMENGGSGGAFSQGIIELAKLDLETKEHRDEYEDNGLSILKELLYIIGDECYDYNIKQLGRYAEVTTDELLDKFHERGIIPEDWKKRDLSTWLVSRELASIKSSNSVRRYLLDRDGIYEFQQSYFPNYDPQIED